MEDENKLIWIAVVGIGFFLYFITTIFVDNFAELNNFSKFESTIGMLICLCLVLAMCLVFGYVIVDVILGILSFSRFLIGLNKITKMNKEIAEKMEELANSFEKTHKSLEIYIKNNKEE